MILTAKGLVTHTVELIGTEHVSHCNGADALFHVHGLSINWCNEGSVRIVDQEGMEAVRGRVEICHDDIWGMCHDYVGE